MIRPEQIERLVNTVWERDGIRRMIVQVRIESYAGHDHVQVVHWIESAGDKKRLGRSSRPNCLKWLNSGSWKRVF